MGAVLFGDSVKNLAPGLHGSTFGGNPLACAAALAALTAIIEEDLSGQAAAKGAYLLEELKSLKSPLIREVRGLGLMVGIELKQKVAPYLAALQEHHVLALNAGLTTIRLLPPLVITREQLDSVIQTLKEVLN
jgi:[amino-group carrier protein]-gamma-(L-lysyl/L-ornithyl)-L-glutamate aminotransferase